MGLDISLIITTWNSRPYLDQCLASLEEIGYDGQLIIADSGSTDGTEDMCHLQTGNHGWAHTVNQAVDHCRYETVIVSNPDIIFNQNLYHLIDKWKQQPDTWRIISPALETRNGRLQPYKKLPQLIDLFITETQTGKWADTLLGKPVWHSREQITRTGQIQWDELPTASLFITSKQILNHYFLDEDMLRAEDWDMWQKLNQDHIPTEWTKNAIFIHQTGHTGKNRTVQQQRTIELQGILQYAQKWRIHPWLLRLLLGTDALLAPLLGKTVKWSAATLKMILL